MLTKGRTAWPAINYASGAPRITDDGEFTTTAGRFFVLLMSLNGNGTRITSPNSSVVVGGIFVVVPDGPKRLF